MHFARLVKQASVDLVYDQFVYGAYMVHRPMWGWHCQSLGKVCWGSLVAFHFPTGPARADHDWIAQLG